jgi:alkanesulfonate monooxygenase SsuD/methylene tetrahydromethanopterin reductase-like flavin-dependent oxidoreductase (luciferase family)
LKRVCPEFTGEFCRFPKVCSYPKPVQKPHPPIIFGGESAPALRRVGEVGNGWFGVNVTPEDAKTKIERMQQYAQAAGRDPGQLHCTVSPGIDAPVQLDQVKRYRDAGVQQVIIGALPRDPKTVQGDIERLAERIVAPAAQF